MSILLHGDCLNEMKGLDDNSIDLIFCDLPYGQTSCKWDCCIDLEKFWIEVMRIKKINTPIFFTTTTKFGVSLINSAPKKCHFRYDIVWVKSAPAGFLSAKKMPMRKHEMIYVFYEKLPFYDLSSHTHKFIKEGKKSEGDKGNECYGKFKYYNNGEKGYEPPLPVSVVKQELCKYDVNKNTYGGGKEGRIKISKDKKDHQQKYDPPLPVSIVKQDCYEKNKNDDSLRAGFRDKKYDPPLPVSVVKEELDEKYKNKGGLYSKVSRNGLLKAEPHYDPPLPVSVVKEENKMMSVDANTLYGDVKLNQPANEDGTRNKYRGQFYEPPLPVSIVKQDCYEKNKKDDSLRAGFRDKKYDPPLPTTMLEIKSTRGKHSTEKPVALMEWILKYYSKEGDTVLDPTMGSGSTGVACKNMNRNLIGVEMDAEIYEVAVNRIED